MLFRQIIHEDLGCASYLVADREAGRRGGDRPAVGHRALPAPGAAARGADRARAGDPQPRRPRLRPRPAGADDRGDDPRPRAGRGRVRRTSRSATAGCWSSARSTIEAIHTPGHRPEHTCLPAARRQPRRRALGAAQRRLAVHRRRRPPRPRGRAARGRGRRCSARCTSACWRSTTRSRSGPATSAARSAAAPGIDLKTSSTIGFERRHNRGPGDRRRGRVRRGRGRLARRQAAERRARSSPSTAARWSTTSAPRRR